MAFDWEKYKEEIEYLYLTERLTLVKLRKRLARQHSNFNPSISSYRTKLREWGFLRKNDRARGSPRTPNREGHYYREGDQSSGEEGNDFDDFLAASPEAGHTPASPGFGEWKPMGVTSGFENLLHPRTPQMSSRHHHSHSQSSSTPGTITSPSSFGSSAPPSTDPSPKTAATSPALTISPSLPRHSPMQGTVSMADTESGQITRQNIPFPPHDCNVKALDQPVDEDGNTLLHMAAKNGPTWEFLALMMKRTGNIATVNNQGETFFHVLDANRMQDMRDAENFLNLCDELGYNFLQPSATTGINGLAAFYQKWPDYTISLREKEHGFTQFILGGRATENLQDDNDLPSAALTYSELPSFSLDFELFENSDLLMNDGHWKPKP